MEHKTALIVEDDARSLLALGSLLDEFGIQYKRNTTGAGVLEQARRVRPDVILLDLTLPDGDPFVICGAVHADPAVSNVPVIAVVDDDAFETLHSGVRQAGFSGVVTKPINPREFAHLMRQLLDQ